MGLYDQMKSWLQHYAPEYDMAVQQGYEQPKEVYEEYVEYYKLVETKKQEAEMRAGVDQLATSLESHMQISDEEDEGWLKAVRQRISEALRPRTAQEMALPSLEHPALNASLQRDRQIETEIQKLRKPAKVEFPPLSQAQIQEVEATLSLGDRDIVVSAFNVDLTGADVKTLRNGEWLNDEIINFYGQLILQRAKNDTSLPRIHYFNTFFLPTLEGKGYSAVRRWTKKIDLLSLDIVIIPVHLGVHWCCSIIDFRKKRIEYYDSLHGSKPSIFKLYRDYLCSEAKDKKSQEFDLEGWTDCTVKTVPAQQNGYDCGVFTCMFARYASIDEPFTFAQRHMPLLRQRMVLEIKNKMLF